MRDVSENYGIPSRTSDPSSPADGDIWYRSDLKQYWTRINSTSVPMNAPISFANPVASAWYDMPGLTTGLPGTTAYTLSQVAAYDFIVGEATTLSGLAWEVTTAGASSNVGRCALYSGDQVPTTMVTDFGTVSQTSTGVKTLSPSQALTPGVQYWIAFASQVGTAATVRTSSYNRTNVTYNVGSGSPASGDFSTTQADYFSWTHTSGSFTSSPTIVVVGGVRPRLLIKFT